MGIILDKTLVCKDKIIYLYLYHILMFAITGGTDVLDGFNAGLEGVNYECGLLSFIWLNAHILWS